MAENNDRQEQNIELEGMEPVRNEAGEVKPGQGDVSYGLTDEDYLAYIEEHMQKRREERDRRKKRGKTTVRVVPIAVVLVLGLIIFSFSGFFTVDSIEVEGNSYFTSEEILNMAHATPGNNIFYNSGKSEMVEYLESNPYIKSAKVVRKFPSTLIIQVEERTQEAAIVYDDDYLIIDSEGTLLRKTATEPKLTIISGIKVSKIELGDKIEAENSKVLDRAIEILQSMLKDDLYFTKIEMSNLYVKAYIYDSFLCKGTTDMLVEAMDNGRLHKVIEDLFDKNVKRGTISFTEEGYASFVPAIE